MSEAMHVGSGKVRELYALDDERLLLVASDRISTFDVVLPTEIPDKGRVLTGLSGFWFARTRTWSPNHLLALRDDGRSTECKRLEMLPIECVVRGYLVRLGLEGLPRDRSGLRASPARRARRVAAAAAADLHAGDEGRRPATTRTSTAPPRSSSSARSASTRSEATALALYEFVSEHARERGIILADTKLEFGIDETGRLVLGDEAFTPDSSRFWPADEYRAGLDAAVVRQAVRPRLLRVARLGQDLSRPRAAGRRRRRHARALRRGVRAADRALVRRLPRRPERGARMRATVLVRPKPGILDPQGQAVESSLRHLGFDGRRRARRPARRRRARDRRPRRGAGRSSSACASSC